MTGPEHYREAEARLEAARRIAHPDSGHTDEDAMLLVRIALQRGQVHATLALAAAAALAPAGRSVNDRVYAAWEKAAS